MKNQSFQTYFPTYIFNGLLRVKFPFGQIQISIRKFSHIYFDTILVYYYTFLDFFHFLKNTIF